MLTEKELEQIREEAERIYPLPYPELTSNGEGVNPSWNYYDNKNIQAGCKREAHIAAVTAERERAKLLLDAFNEIERIHYLYHKSEGNNPASNHLRNIAFEAMIKYNKK